MNSNDTLYVDVRDKNFSVVSRILSSKAKTLKTSEDSRHDARTFTEIKDFVKKLGAPRPAPPCPNTEGGTPHASVHGAQPPARAGWRSERAVVGNWMACCGALMACGGEG